MAARTTTLTLGPKLETNGNALTVRDDATLNLRSMGTFDIEGGLTTIRGSLNFFDAAQLSAGTLNVVDDGLVNVTGSSLISDATTISGGGTVFVNVNSNWTTSGAATIGESSSVVVNLNSEWEISGTLDVSGVLGVNGSEVTVSGAAELDSEMEGSKTLEIENGGVVRFNGGGANNANSIVDVNDGTLDLADKELTNAGTITTGSAGEIVGDDEAGKFTVDGDLTQTADGKTVVNIGGTQEVDEFDKHSVFIIDDVDRDSEGGTLTLDGELEVKLIDVGAGVFDPVVGDLFSIMRASEARVDKFDVEKLDLPDLDGKAWEVIYEKTKDEEVDGEKVGLDDTMFEVLLKVTEAEMDISIDGTPFTASLESYGAGQDFGGTDQDTDSQVTMLDGGTTLQLSGDGWKKMALNYNVTEHTMLEFDFSSSSEGEIHAIGFDNNDDIDDPIQAFKLHGTQDWGIDTFDNYAGGTQHFVIPVGQFMTGNMNYLTFINDHDVTSPTAESIFSNVEIYENVPELSVNGNPEVVVTEYGGDGQNPDGLAIATTSADHLTLDIDGNGWRKIAFNYTITPDTVLEFDFSSSTEGEIHGIGFDTDNGISQNRTFQLFGTQNWGISDFNNYTSGNQHYAIPVGQYFTGTFSFLTFVNDHDVSSPTAESVFSNIQVYEAAAAAASSGGGESFTQQTSAAGFASLTDSSPAESGKLNLQTSGDRAHASDTTQDVVRPNVSELLWRELAMRRATEGDSTNREHPPRAMTSNQARDWVLANWDETASELATAG